LRIHPHKQELPYTGLETDDQIVDV